MPLVFDILFAIVAAIFIAIGVKRGFIKSLIHSAKLLLAIIITYFVGPFTSKFIYGAFVYKPIYNWLEKFGTNVVDTLPKFLQPKEDVIGKEITPVAESVSNVISNVVGYIVTFILAIVLLSVLAWLLSKLADRIDFLGTANRVLGGIFGAVMGFVFLFIIAIIVKTVDVDSVVYGETFIVKFLGNLAP